MRFNVFRQRGTYALAMRILSFEVPDWGDLFVPEAVVKFTHLQRGLILLQELLEQVNQLRWHP